MDNLPNELVAHILGFCDPVTLVTCRSVCKSICKLIEVSTRLQYNIELFADGMTETYLPSPLSPAERLSLLRSRRAAWRELRWCERPIPVISSSWSAYELVGGIFSKTLDLDEHNNARGILFTTLPSVDAPGSLTQIDNVGIPFRDFAMDPAQDLIVYMQCSRVSGPLIDNMLVTLHFRTMSNNRPHPRALDPLTSIVLENINIMGAVIQTVNDTVGLMAWGHSRSQLHVWDWTQSKLLVSESHLHTLDDFAFISDRAYVLTSPSPEPCFRVYTFHANPHADAPPAPPTLRATLRLPPMYEGANASQLGIHTGPFTASFQDLYTGPAKPFIHNSHCRIHIISLELWVPQNLQTPTSCLLVVHNSTFLGFTGANPKAEPADLDWFAWGPDHTHWLPGTTGSSWLRYVHGERLVRLHAPTEYGPRCLEVYDFGAPRGPRSLYDPRECPMSVLKSSVFTQPVVGRLPCHIVKKRGDFPYSGFMVDEEHLIGLKRDFSDRAEMDVFAF